MNRLSAYEHAVVRHVAISVVFAFCDRFGRTPSEREMVAIVDQAASAIHRHMEPNAITVTLQ